MLSTATILILLIACIIRNHKFYPIKTCIKKNLVLDWTSYCKLNILWVQKKKPLANNVHLIFVGSIPIMMILGMIWQDSSISFNLYDTYYFISFNGFTKFVTVFFGLFGLGYWLIRKSDQTFSKYLKWIHIALTFGSIIIIPFLAQLYRSEIHEYEFNSTLNFIISVTLITLILSQLLFPINFLYVLLRQYQRNNE